MQSSVAQVKFHCLCLGRKKRASDFPRLAVFQFGIPNFFLFFLFFFVKTYSKNPATYKKKKFAGYICMSSVGRMLVQKPCPAVFLPNDDAVVVVNYKYAKRKKRNKDVDRSFCQAKKFLCPTITQMCLLYKRYKRAWCTFS